MTTEAAKLSQEALPQGARRGSSWRIDSIDGLRALAMLMVFFWHSWQFAGFPRLAQQVGGAYIDFDWFALRFDSAVDLFLVISGFCLFWPLCKSTEAAAKWQWQDYSVRRVRRMVPPYYMAIIFATLLPQVLVVFYKAIGQPANWQPLQSFPDYLTHALFIHTLFVDYWNGINGSLWTLSLEAQFYLMFPCVVLAFRRVGWHVVWVICGVSVVYRIIAGSIYAGAPEPVPFLVSIFFLGRWMQFAMGMGAAIIVARWVRSGTRLPSWVGSLMFLAAVGLWFVAAHDPGSSPWHLPVRDTCYGVAATLAIIAVCGSNTPFRKPFEFRPMVWLGFVSYSVFLIHQPTIWYVSQFMHRRGIGSIPHLVLLCTIGFGVVLFIGHVFFKFFEEPFMGAPRHKAPAPATPAKQPEAVPA